MCVVLIEVCSKSVFVVNRLSMSKVVVLLFGIMWFRICIMKSGLIRIVRFVMKLRVSRGGKSLNKSERCCMVFMLF